MKAPLAPALGLALVLAAAAPPARAELPPALAKAKARYETDIAKADEVLLANMDRAIAAAAKTNKALAGRYTFEKDQFVKHRIVPTTFSATNYVKQRNAATEALEVAFAPAVKALRKAKKDAEADELEKEWSGLLRAARGYGLAFPDLEPRVGVLIENKACGLVLEVKGTGKSEAQVVLAPKVGRARPQQCWVLEREERGFVIRHWTAGLALAHAETVQPNTSPFRIERYDTEKETPERYLFAPTELGREVALIGSERGGRALGVIERTVKGVGTFELAYPSKVNKVPDRQRWIVSEAK